MIVVGLTGSIGMGKSTTAAMFRNAGVPVHDSDKVVHSLYNGAEAWRIEAVFPGSLIDGKIDRGILGKRVLGDREAMKRLEDIVHPLVGNDRNAFLERMATRGESIVVLDIPLLFEIGGVEAVDVIVVVSASAAVQKARVMAREGMTEERFAAILAKQIPDAEKRTSAHFVIDTGFGIEAAATQVRAVLRAVGSSAHPV